MARQEQSGVIYLIHFNTPYRHAAHYCGFVACAEGLEHRLDQHRRGTGARLMEVITQAGIEWKLVRTWEGDRNFERRLKKRGGAARICPCCRAAKKAATEQTAHPINEEV